MLSIDSATFLIAVTCLVAIMRWLPKGPASLLHLAISMGVWTWLLPDTRSLVVAIVFVLLPFGLSKLTAGRRYTAAFIIFVQVGLFLWVREYPSLIPALASLAWLDLSIAIVGISYILFRQIDWTLQADANPNEKSSLVEYLNFTLSLFTILAGPIARFDDFRTDFLQADAAMDRKRFLSICNRIVNGYVKVALLAPLLAHISSFSFVDSNEYSLPARLISFYGYPFFIYLNFAGYCDVVIGLAKLAKFDLPENFNRPFLSTNVQEFWQRWHISFSTWIRDYVFYPLLKGMRTHVPHLPARVAMMLSLFLSFILVGLWHGPTISYLIFGLLHGIAVAVVAPYDRLLHRILSERGMDLYLTHPASRCLRVLVCFHFLCATIALFERTPEQALALMPF